MDIIISVLNEIKEFEQKNTGGKSLEDFRLWLNCKAYQKESPTILTRQLELEVYELENEIAKQIILINRYTKHILKKALIKNEHLANEDFTYLFRMMHYKQLTKTQLIEKNAHEKQTGTEIINRLVNKNLLKETPNKQDKRSVQISITELGKKVFHESINDITRASKLLCGKLNTEEKTQFLYYLKFLNDFHQIIYLNHKSSDFSELEKML